MTVLFSTTGSPASATGELSVTVYSGSVTSICLLRHCACILPAIINNSVRVMPGLLALNTATIPPNNAASADVPATTTSSEKTA